MTEPGTQAETVAASVRRWYDEHGWQRDQSTGLYRDTATFSGPGSGSVAADLYVRTAHADLTSAFGGGGVFLDAASGPVVADEYVEWSRRCSIRLCIDISGVALREARNRLGDSGVYVQSDMAALPLGDGSVDSGVSAYTVQHVAADQQMEVLRELYRVLAPGQRLHIITAVEPPLRRWAYRALRRPMRRFTYKAKQGVEQLYYQAQSPKWWRQALEDLGASGEVRTLRLLRPNEYRLLFRSASAPVRWLRALERSMPRATLPLCTDALVTIEKPPR